MFNIDDLVIFRRSSKTMPEPEDASTQEQVCKIINVYSSSVVRLPGDIIVYEIEYNGIFNWAIEEELELAYTL